MADTQLADNFVEDVQESLLNDSNGSAEVGNTTDGAGHVMTPVETTASNVKDPQWRWPSHEKWYSTLEGTWKTRETEKTKSPLDGLQCPFEVTTLIEERDEVLSGVTVKLWSPYLITLLRKLLSSAMATRFSEETDIDAKDLFGARDCLKEELKIAQHGCNTCSSEAPQDVCNGVHPAKTEDPSQGTNGTTSGDVKTDAGGDGITNGVRDGEAKALSCLHLQHLLRFLDEHFKDVSAKFAWMQQEGLVSYDMLWTFLTPGVEVRRMCNISGQPCHAVISEKGKYSHKSWDPERNAFKIKLKVMDYDGESYRACSMTYKIEEFEGEVPFTSLRVCPWSFFPSHVRDAMPDTLRQRGQLFYDYAVKEAFRFMHFRGSLCVFERNDRGCFELVRMNADGRVMVDLLSLARVNPDWPLGNAQPSSKLLRGLADEDVSASEATTTKMLKEPTEEELRRAPAIVHGFSFSVKRWGCFDVEGLREITFEDEAYEQLVMKSVKQKEMLKAIVASHLSQGHKGLDVVAQKGAGCVVLCYGPPGTGKTLTAESLAETLHRPLWAISAFELGEEAGELERRLSEVLSTALRWRAVVLLDEADGYLERRACNVDVRRNLLTGVFLRLLEYYGGVLFLTTNRVGAFDDAFLSRISLCIRYPALDDGRRGSIWRALLARAGVVRSGEEEEEGGEALKRLVECGHPLNGREIRNVISLAQTWAQSRGQAVGLSHVQDALQLVVSGCRELLADLGAP